MHLADIDYIAVSGKSSMHKAGVFSKIIFTMLLLTSVIITNDIEKILVIIAITLAFFFLSGVPLKQVIHMAMYPAFFSLLFAFIMAQQSLLFGLLIVLKAISAALLMILLITTTTYIDLFSFLSLFLPGLLVDIFLFTYRSFFILLSKLSNLFRSIRLRGGYKPLSLLQNIRNIAGMLGLLVIHSLEMNERMYKIYSLRGYQGKLPVYGRMSIEGVFDIVLIITGIVILTGVYLPWNLL